MRLNEGLKYIEGDKGRVFMFSGIETVYLPSTLQRMSDKLFLRCDNLRRVEVAAGSGAGVDYRLPTGAVVVTVPVAVQAEEEPDSDSAQNES